MNTLRVVYHTTSGNQLSPPLPVSSIGHEHIEVQSHDPADRVLLDVKAA